MEKKTSLGLFFTAAICFGLTVALLTPYVRKKEPKFLAPPPEGLEYFNFGFRGSLADSLWLRWIQDADVCYGYSGLVIDLDPSKAEKDEFHNPRKRICDNSWGFKMLDAVTKLDPKFVMPYMAGATALSVLVEDYEGASVIFDRGVEVYPNDWQLSYRAAYHFLFDKKDVEKAARLLNASAAHGGPEWLLSLAARLFSRAGQLELGLANLLEYRKSFKDEDHPGLKEVNRRIAEMTAELKKERAKSSK